MSTFLFHALSFHLILQNKSVYIWFFLLLLFLFVVFSVFFFFLKGYISVPCLIHGDLSSFQFASIRQMLCRIRSFYFFISFLFSLLLTSHLRPVSLSELCVSCLRVKIAFLRVQVSGKSSLCYLVAPPWWQTWLVSLSLGIPTLSQVESQPKSSHQSMREWGSKGVSLIKGLGLRYTLVISWLHYLPWGSG